MQIVTYFCVYVIRKPVEKATVEVGCKFEVMDRGVVYAAKVTLLI